MTAGGQVQRGLWANAEKWRPHKPLLSSLEDEAGITAGWLRAAMKRFFATAAAVLGETNPGLAKKLCCATRRWTRYTHASHALGHGADRTTLSWVRKRRPKRP